MKRRTLLCAFIVGCGGSSTTGNLDAVPAHDVAITVDVPGVCIVGGCDPVSAAVHTLGLIRVRNVGTTTAFVHACGPRPAFVDQQLVGGAWVNVGPAASCTFPSTPIPVAAGDSLRFNAFYASGTRRVGVGVADNASLSGEEFAASAAFVIR
ncbi:MAG TPA: hypothetical protein VGQ56_10470 [Gemmatimonadaceae bacterium]|jgi:hypothetical protein|nr:hypothetical protein [Gemmatimonadaceae bacterium]